MLQFCSDFQYLRNRSLILILRESRDAYTGLIGPLYSLVLHQHANARLQVMIASPPFISRYPTFFPQLHQHLKERGDAVDLTVTAKLHVSTACMITRLSRDAFAQEAIVFRLLLNRPYISNYAQVFIPAPLCTSSVACPTPCDAGACTGSFSRRL